MSRSLAFVGLLLLPRGLQNRGGVSAAQVNISPLSTRTEAELPSFLVPLDRPWAPVLLGSRLLSLLPAQLMILSGQMCLRPTGLDGTKSFILFIVPTMRLRPTRKQAADHVTALIT